MRIQAAIGTALLLFSFGAIHAAGFSDITASPYGNAIQNLEKLNVVQGYDDGTFRPTRTINRAELLTILMNARYPDDAPSDLRCFKDLDVRVPQWFAKPVCLGKDLGVVTGYPDGAFRPGRSVNLVEALAMTFRAFGISTATSETSWYQPLLMEARSRSLLPSLLSDPAHVLRRGEMASLIDAMMTEASPPGQQTATGSATGICGNGIREGREECDDGTANGTPDATCSSLCLSLADPVRRGLLSIEQRPTNVTPVIAAGQKDLPLLKFTAVAGRQDVRLNSISFSANVGSLLYGRNYRLLTNRTGGSAYDLVRASATVDREYLTFDLPSGGSGVILPVGIPVPFLVLADLPPDLGPVTLRLQFADDLATYIEAQGAADGLDLEGVSTDGICTAPNCFISVATTAASTLSINTAGTLTVMKDTTPVRSHLLLAGSVTPELLRLRLRAEGENIEIRSLGIDGVTDAVDSLQFYKLAPGTKLDPDLDAPFARGTAGQCSVTMTARACANLGVSSLVIPAGEEVIIAVAARLKSDQAGGRSGTALMLSLSDAIDDRHAMEVVGASSKRTLLQNDGSGSTDGEILIGTTGDSGNNAITGTTGTTTFASISAVTNIGPVTDYLPAGNAVIGSFTLAASPSANSFLGSKDVRLKSIVFQLNARNVLLDPAGFTLSTADDEAISSPCSASASTGTFNVTCSALNAGLIDNRIAAGGSAAYLLHGNIVNPQVASYTESFLQTSPPVLGQSTVVNSILWSDGTTDFTWVDIPATSVEGTAMRSR
ncbi:MAG: S-layer homology domain-containing protein [Candidatus Peribacteraceae bacterium]|nr:S-layer homology domain-containing protein [Candidatus Peribacteraceae bacterium]